MNEANQDVRTKGRNDSYDLSQPRWISGSQFGLTILTINNKDTEKRPNQESTE